MVKIPNEINGWKIQPTQKDHYQWKYNDEQLYMSVRYTTNGYVRTDDGEKVQEMRWTGKLTIGTNITVGENKHVICRDISKEEAKEICLDWAINFMKDFDFEKYCSENDISDSLSEYNEYHNNK